MNFALFQLASQSSQTSPGRSASKAVDGDEATLPHTELDDSRPWWKVRLAYPIWVTNVEIVNTDDNGKLERMDLLPDTQTCWLRMRRECRERFPRNRRQRKLWVSDPGMYHGTCVTHVPWCMSGSPTGGGGEKVPGIPGACANHYFTYLARGPWNNIPGRLFWYSQFPVIWSFNWPFIIWLFL